MTKERKIKVNIGLQNLLQCIYRVVHVYPSLVLIIFQFFSESRVCMALCLIHCMVRSDFG